MECQNCHSLTDVFIPNSIVKIKYDAFVKCSLLTELTIPKSINIIGEYAFEKCKKLSVINYTGTEEEWNNVKFGTTWNLDCPSDMKINCNYAEEN